MYRIRNKHIIVIIITENQYLQCSKILILSRQFCIWLLMSSVRRSPTTSLYCSNFALSHFKAAFLHALILPNTIEDKIRKIKTLMLFYEINLYVISTETFWVTQVIQNRHKKVAPNLFSREQEKGKHRLCFRGCQILFIHFSTVSIFSCSNKREIKVLLKLSSIALRKLFIEAKGQPKTDPIGIEVQHSRTYLHDQKRY